MPLPEGTPARGSVNLCTWFLVVPFPQLQTQEALSTDSPQHMAARLSLKSEEARLSEELTVASLFRSDFPPC